MTLNNRRFSIFAFPQFFDGDSLTVNIVVLPRNQNPLKGAIIDHDGLIFLPPVIPDAPAFADAKLSFEAKIISGLSIFPHNLLPNATRPLPAGSPSQSRTLFEALAKNFKITTDSQAQDNADLETNLDKAKNHPALPQSSTVKKYLPVSYRAAFNFTNPRTPNASIDDAYHCALRDAGRVPGFTRSKDEISWGKVFAYALRQPQLAAQLGMIYQSSFKVVAADFPLGGWLYVDLADGSDYKAQQLADDTFIKRYAARIPPLKLASSRQVFTPLLFPVGYKANAAAPDPLVDGNYDQLFIETAEYDDGFAKIVHAAQPPSQNLLVEKTDGDHPVHDVGIRLGWDDEQILIWYMRQMAIDPTVTKNPDQRLDAPLGVFGYAIDVRNLADPTNPFESLNSVKTKLDLAVSNLPDEPVKFASKGNPLELPYQVYPTQLDGDKSKNFWLPMYFASWNGHSIVLPDQTGSEIYQNTDPSVKADPKALIPVAKQDPADPEFPNKTTGTGSSGPAKNQLNQQYAPGKLETILKYGELYEFRIRLQDLSGGGPILSKDINPVNASASDKARVRFKRFVAPNQVRAADLPFNTDQLASPDHLTIQRPLLGYPAVVYTAKYSDPVTLLKNASIAMIGKEAFGIPDPDVNRVEVTVEVETLRMDNLLSVSGSENYVVLYTTTRSFPPAAIDADYEASLNLRILYRDCPVMHIGAELDLVNDLGLPDEIDKLSDIYLPTGRTIRLTLRAVCEEKPNDANYYGSLNPNPELDVRYGQILQTRIFSPSLIEKNLFVNAPVAEELQAIYLQPDPLPIHDGKVQTLVVGQPAKTIPDMVQLLARQLKAASNGLTLTALAGERIVFGCSNRIRHTLSPEGSSITFSSKNDLLNHWLCCVVLQIDRDWTWDALQDRSFVVTRTTHFTHDNPASETEVSEVGTLELRHTAAFQALKDPQRDFTRLIFIDAVEPKNARMQPLPNEKQLRFPDTIEVAYSVETFFKPGYAAKGQDGVKDLAITLPITTTPGQTPQIASAGIALSPYQRNEKYSASQPRQRYLWIEFSDPIEDPNDAIFARVLAYTPDQLLSNNEPDLLIAPQEPALPIDPEYIRVVPPGATNDLAGLSAMQLMEKASDSERHYLLPIPPGLNSNSAEMFGFFTYEFRVGHYRNKDTNAMAWCTAQGRFGRPLKATGIQHPAPTLTCNVNRDKQIISVSAPYAVAVFDGRNVTADPPRTELWALFYAQVKQADNLDYRNILLDDKKLDWRVQIETNPNVDWVTQYDIPQRSLLKNISVKNWKDDLSYANFQHVYQLADTSTIAKDATKYGVTVWSNDEISQMLALYGLPGDSALSVLVVEILPTITNVYEHFPWLANPDLNNHMRQTFQMGTIPDFSRAREEMERLNQTRDYLPQPDPLSDELGQHRILRTSPLTEVPVVC